jgi:glutathione-specific gamma-glutamylcyclotransferase
MPHLLPPFELTRETVLGDSIRALVRAIDPDIHLLTSQEHRASIAALLARRPDSGDVWLFGYGSLIWNPLIRFTEKRIGTIKGYHRCFCLWTHLGRGTVEKPGLMLGLEPGGSCRGVAFRIAEALAVEELEICWRREMLTNAYAPRWMRVSTGDGPLHALVFRINRSHRRYAGRLPEDTVIASIAQAHGPLGACATYLFNTVAHPEDLGICDRRLIRLRDQVAARVRERRR